MSLSWPLAGAAGTQINITVASLANLTNGAYTIASLTKPKASRGATLSAKVSTTIRAELITDTNAMYGAASFTAGPSTTTGNWHWMALTKAAGTVPYNLYRKDVTAGTATVTSSTGAETHADFGSATSIVLGQGDNESRDDHALIVVWLRALSSGEIATLFGATDLSTIIGMTPDALWPMNIPAPAGVKDITGHGNNASSVDNPSNIVMTANPPGFTWSDFFDDSEMGTSETFDPATVAIEFTVSATSKLYRASSFFPAVSSGTPGFRLYTSTGTTLASGPFDTAVADQRNYFTPSSPITLNPGTTYIAAQFVNRYKFVAGKFSSAITRNGVTVNRGLFISTDNVPTNASTAWYGIDVEVVPTASGPGPQSSSDSGALTETEKITVRDADTITLAETMKVGTQDTDGATLTEAVKLATTTSDTFTLSDTERPGFRDSDAFTLTETFKGSVSDSDTGLLSETERGNVSVSESYTLDDSIVKINVTASDVFTLTSELMKLGLTQADAFTVADATFSMDGEVTSSDTFALIESQSMGGMPEDRRSSPITIKLRSPSINIGLNVPGITINLNH